MTASPPPGPPNPPSPGTVTLPPVVSDIELLPPGPGRPAVAAILIGHGAMTNRVQITVDALVPFLRGLLAQGEAIEKMARGLDGQGIMTVGADAMGQIPAISEMLRRARNGQPGQG